MDQIMASRLRMTREEADISPLLPTVLPQSEVQDADAHMTKATEAEVQARTLNNEIATASLYATGQITFGLFGFKYACVSWSRTHPTTSFIAPYVRNKIVRRLCNVQLLGLVPITLFCFAQAVPTCAGVVEGVRAKHALQQRRDDEMAKREAIYKRAKRRIDAARGEEQPPQQRR